MDLVGVRPDDLLVLPKEPGKKSIISGADGAIQSKYFFRKKTTPFHAHATAAPKWKDAYLRVYDRRQMKIEAAKTPTFGSAAHTRVEVVAVWKKHCPTFMALGTMGHHLGAVSVRRRKFQAVNDPLWAPFCDVLELRGWDAAKAMFPVQVLALPTEVFPSNDPIWRPDALMDELGKGLVACGLADWLSKAATV